MSSAEAVLNTRARVYVCVLKGKKACTMLVVNYVTGRDNKKYVDSLEVWRRC